MKKDNVIKDKSYAFALRIVKYYKILSTDRKEYILSKQLLRSGTSIGANIIEAQNAESKSDFIRKLMIAAKEADETEYWLLLCKHSKSYPNADKIIGKLQPVVKILTKIIATSKKSKTIKK